MRRGKGDGSRYAACALSPCGLSCVLSHTPPIHTHTHTTHTNTPTHNRAMRPSTLTQLCEAHGLQRPADTRGHRFENFGGFVETYIAACACLREPSDLRRLVLEVAEDAAASGAIWIELGLSILLYHERFGGVEGTLDILLRAAEAAEDATGVSERKREECWCVVVLVCCVV